MIRKVEISDAAAICDIYNHYIDNTIVTFDEQSLDAGQMAQRIESISVKYPYLVYQQADRIVGYAYVGAWKARASFRHTVESTVYVDKDYLGKGIGRKLMIALMDEVEKTDIHAVIAGISLPNQASVALHRELGFKRIGVFREVGYKHGRWIDVVYWQWKRGT